MKTRIAFVTRSRGLIGAGERVADAQLASLTLLRRLLTDLLLPRDDPREFNMRCEDRGTPDLPEETAETPETPDPREMPAEPREMPAEPREMPSLLLRPCDGTRRPAVMLRGALPISRR